MPPKWANRILADKQRGGLAVKEMFNAENPARQIGRTPLSISVYSVKKSPTLIHAKGVLEIIFCLKGSVRFSYAYEAFTLHAGEYISVDKDAYYLYDGKDNLCVSFYIDLFRYKEKYPFITNNLFVCEGLAETTMDYPTDAHHRLKGMLIGTLKYIVDGEHEEKIEKLMETVVGMFIKYFDIFSFHTGIPTLDGETSERIHEINNYMQEHMRERITIGDLAKKLNLSEGYLSEYMRKVSIGFREMLSYIRANESERYLLKTEKTIVEISEECGFSDAKYYYAAFKRWYKCTPRQFRDRYGKMQEKQIEYRSAEDVKNLLDGIIIEHYMEVFVKE